MDHPLLDEQDETFNQADLYIGNGETKITI
jgi:hypothetical protein